METNENTKREHYQAAEKELFKLIEEIEGIEEGNIKNLEEMIYQGIFKIGGKLMECTISKGGNSGPIQTRIQGECGHEQNLVSYRTKKLLTMFGEIEYKRAYYQCQITPDQEKKEEMQEKGEICSHGRAPSDEKWGIQGTRTTPGVQQTISYFCSMLTFEEAAEAFERLLPLGMSARQALNLARPVGNALAEQEDEIVKEIFSDAVKSKTDDNKKTDDTPVKDIRRLYIEMDGILARMRRGSVPMEEHEKKRDGDVYREVKVGAIFEAEQGRERSELVPDVYIDTPKEGNKLYVARRTAKGGFGQLLYAQALLSGLHRAVQIVVLGDGALWIWKQADEHFPGAVQIVDLYHAKEHVWEVAHAVYGRQGQDACIWAEQACTLLVNGQIEELVTLISKLPSLPPAEGSGRSVPERAVDYFTSNAERMRYSQFRAQGMHVGSGIAEAACKTVVGVRAKGTGMRWTPDGLDAILPLRTAKLSGTYDQFCEEHSRLVA
jgi:hypothetical protein